MVPKLPQTHNMAPENGFVCFEFVASELGFFITTLGSIF